MAIRVGDFDLFLVLEHFFEAVVGCRGKRLDFFVEFRLHLRGNLVGPDGEDGNGFVNVACAFVELVFLTGDNRRFCLDFLEIHDYLMFSNFFLALAAMPLTSCKYLLSG